jgi:tetratricopeptide (TPR) repeat protein
MAYENINNLKIEWFRTQTLFFLGQIELNLGHDQLSAEYFRQALASAYSDTTERRSYNTLYEIAQLHQFLKRPDSAIFYAKKSLAEAQENHLYSVITKAGSMLASLYAEKDPAKGLLL